MSYYSDKQQGPKPRNIEDINQVVWHGIISVVKRRITDGSLGYGFPEECQDGNATCGCDENLFSIGLSAEVHDIKWTGYYEQVPPTLAVLDFIQFCYRNVGEPIKIGRHNNHFHLVFDHEQGKERFREDINRILARNGIAYVLTEDGEIKRLVTEVLREIINIPRFQTEDAELNEMLENARNKIFDPDLNVRKDSLEKLWDAWERLKTIETGKDKKDKTRSLLDKTAAEPNFRQLLEYEARELTDVGNNFMIRHKETNKIPIKDSQQVDYFFHRLYSLIYLILRNTGRL